jgi:hypothetical protein
MEDTRFVIQEVSETFSVIYTIIKRFIRSENPPQASAPENQPQPITPSELVMTLVCDDSVEWYNTWLAFYLDFL